MGPTPTIRTRLEDWMERIDEAFSVLREVAVEVLSVEPTA